jgi:hypothetical protein
MKRFGLTALGLFAALLILGGSAYAQGVFKIPFGFEAGGKKLPAGEYWAGPKGENQIALRNQTTGTEVLVPVQKRLEQPRPPIAEFRLVFNMVGNFEPSYTEYVTDYILAELWLPGEDGYLTHVLKGAHQTQVVKGEKEKK